MKILSQKEQKELVGRTAVDRLIERGLIFSGMKIGLGTGSTAITAVQRLADRIQDGTLTGIKAVSTSFQTTIACEDLGIPVFSLNSRDIGGNLDLAIDGADEIDPSNNVIKGGGAAHLNEKIVEYNARIFVVIADESKMAEHLGTKFPLPVEVIPAARVPVCAALERLGAKCTVREGVRKAGPVVTDNGNIVVDCLWKAVETPDGKTISPVNPAEMEDTINRITGVVENGFFTKKLPIVFTAYADGTVRERKPSELLV